MPVTRQKPLTRSKGSTAATKRSRPKLISDKGKKQTSRIPVSLRSGFNPTTGIKQVRGGSKEEFLSGDENQLFKTPSKGRIVVDDNQNQTEQQLSTNWRRKSTINKTKGVEEQTSKSRRSRTSSASTSSSPSSTSPYFLRSKGPADESEAVDARERKPRHRQSSADLRLKRGKTSQNSSSRDERKEDVDKKHSVPDRFIAFKSASKKNSEDSIRVGNGDDEVGGDRHRHVKVDKVRGVAEPVVYLEQIGTAFSSITPSTRSLRRVAQLSGNDAESVGEVTSKEDKTKKRKREENSEEDDDLLNKSTKVFIVDAFQMKNLENPAATGSGVDDSVATEAVKQISGNSGDIRKTPDDARDVFLQHELQASTMETPDSGGTLYDNAIVTDNGSGTENSVMYNEMTDGGSLAELTDYTDSVAYRPVHDLTKNISVRSSWSAHLYETSHSLPFTGMKHKAAKQSAVESPLKSSSFDFQVDWGTSAVKNQLLDSLTPRRSGSFAPAVTGIGCDGYYTESKAARARCQTPVSESLFLRLGRSGTRTTDAVSASDQIVHLFQGEKKICEIPEHDKQSENPTILHCSTPFPHQQQPLASAVSYMKDAEQILKADDQQLDTVQQGKSLQEEEEQQTKEKARFSEFGLNGGVDANKTKKELIVRMSPSRGSLFCWKMIFYVVFSVLIVGLGCAIHLAVAAGYVGSFS